MIRRSFWLLLGTAAGVTGYRRATKLARAMMPGSGQLARGQLARGQLARGQLARGQLSGAAGFLRDVREGRAEYLDRHSLHRGPTLEGQQIGDHYPPETDRTRACPGTDYAKDGR
jgi:hypothetical protein